jgi:integrase/recombinase XerD
VHALVPVLGYLRELGVTPVPDILAPATPAEQLQGRYRRYLASERGLGAATAAALRLLTAAEVTAFVVASCLGKPKGSAKLTVCAPRSLLGWLHVDGQRPCRPLDGAAPAAVFAATETGALATLPKARPEY